MTRVLEAGELTNLTTAHRVAANRMRVRAIGIAEAVNPVSDVDVVAVLFDDVIAAEPVEVIPVAHLILHFGIAVLTRTFPDAVAVPVDAAIHQATDLTGFDLFDHTDVGVLIVTLITADNLEVLFIGNLGGGDRHAVTASVDGARFFHENVLAGVDGVREVNRAETRSRRDDNGIALVNRLLISVETEENAVLQIIAIVFHFGIRVRGRFRCRLKSVGNRDNFDVVADVKTLLEGAATTTAATDER